MPGVHKKQPATPSQHAAKRSSDEATIATESGVKTGAVEGPDPATAMCCAKGRGREGKEEVSQREGCFGSLWSPRWSLVLSPVSPGPTFLLLAPSYMIWQQRAQASQFQMTTLRECVYTAMSSLLCTTPLPTGGNARGPRYSPSPCVLEQGGKTFLEVGSPPRPILAGSFLFFFLICS